MVQDQTLSLMRNPSRAYLNPAHALCRKVGEG